MKEEACLSLRSDHIACCASRFAQIYYVISTRIDCSQIHGFTAGFQKETAMFPPPESCVRAHACGVQELGTVVLVALISH